MGSFRRIEGDQAGPDALGILVPPARRTFVILRPRSLSLDAVLCRGKDDLRFADFSQSEASAAAQAIYRELRSALGRGEEVIRLLPGEQGNRVCIELADLILLVCPREPGKPYTALVCSEADAREYQSQLHAILCPGENREQEVYFNTRFFDPTP